MLLDTAATGLPPLDLTKIVLAIGALGTAAYGLVDVSKGFGGGISNRGFGDIKKVVSPFIPASSPQTSASALSLDSVLATLRSNWLNGMALSDQKSVAKALIKLNLNADTAARMAAATGVDNRVLASIATKLSTGQALTPEETDSYGRFDLLLSAVSIRDYQRADQRYRNSSKLLAVPVAVGLGCARSLGHFPRPTPTPRHLEGHSRRNPCHPPGPGSKRCRERDSARSKLAQAWKK